MGQIRELASATEIGRSLRSRGGRRRDALGGRVLRRTGGVLSIVWATVVGCGSAESTTGSGAAADASAPDAAGDQGVSVHEAGPASSAGEDGGTTSQPVDHDSGAIPVADAASAEASSPPPPPPAQDSGPDGTTGVTSSGAAVFASDRVIVTGVRGTAAPTASSIISLHNGGSSAAQVTALSITGANAALFQVTTAVPATIAPGADLAVTVAMTTTGAGLPTAPSDFNLGSNLLTGTLSATSTAGTAQASVYGLLLIQANYEPTLGQILTTLGYGLDVGQAQNNWNPNTSMVATNLPGVEKGTDEVAAPLFVKSGTGPVTMSVVARFSPVGILPYGWYPASNSATRTTVGTMSMVTDAQTSNKARMVYPPLAAGSATSFDPGTAPFGLWVFSDQKTQQFNEGGNMTNGDYDYSQDALNSPANVHRFKTYPLADASRTRIPGMFLVAVEEAGNGDYQDYVFVLGNAAVAP